MNQKDFIDYNIVDVIGIDVEKEDRDVGIFGNNFILCFKDESGKLIQLSLFDNQMIKLRQFLKDCEVLK